MSAAEVEVEGGACGFLFSLVWAVHPRGGGLAIGSLGSPLGIYCWALGSRLAKFVSGKATDRTYLLPWSNI